MVRFIQTRYSGKVMAIVCYNHPALAQWGILRFCRRNDIRHVPDATEWYASSNGSLIFRAVKWCDTTLRMRFVHAWADGVIATSRYLASYYQSKGCSVVELPTLCDSAALAMIPALPRPVPRETKRLLYAGSPFDPTRLGRRRRNIKDRLDLVVEILSRVHARGHRFVLEIYGLTKDNYLAAFPEHASALLEVGDAISFHGRKPFPEIIGNIKSSDFTIFLRHPTRVNLAGFPTKFSESLVCGTPVITNMLSNLQGYLRDGANGFVLDIDDLAAAERKMEAILALDNERLANLRQACLASKELDYPAFSLPVRRFLEKLSGGQP